MNHALSKKNGLSWSIFLKFPTIFFLYRDAKQADVPEGGRLSVTCIASGAKPQAYIYWNSEPKLNNTTVRLLRYIYILQLHHILKQININRTIYK